MHSLSSMNYYTSQQFGFRKYRATYMGLLCMLDKLHDALENGDNALGIFIDFRKAFDNVDHSWDYYSIVVSDHSILLYKLYHYGVRGPAYDGFCDYLNNRTQLMSFNNVHSILFADDTNIFDTNKEPKALINNVNSELHKIMNLLNANKLSLNIDKTHFILFKTKGKIITNNCKVYMNHQEISVVNSTKVLGVIINNQLNWKNHLVHICTKLSKNIGIILKARRVFDKRPLLSLCYRYSDISLPDILYTSVGLYVSKLLE